MLRPCFLIDGRLNGMDGEIFVCVPVCRRRRRCCAADLRQTRCLLTSIATNHVATGLLVTVWNIYPSLIGCWPYGVLLCQIQVSCVIIHFAFYGKSFHCCNHLIFMAIGNVWDFFFLLVLPGRSERVSLHLLHQRE
jgi:hypothetical protein